ncbi:MAG TPA: TatD family hydrolase [Acidimicrobiales bacterium]|nr:TatD family hydrolase [Acidimicrobiales bacterium]
MDSGAAPGGEGGGGGRADAVVEWFDSHCHLQTEYLAGDQGEGQDLPGAHAEPHASRLAGAVARASEAGVTRMVCVGTDATTSAEAVELARAMARADSVATAEGIQMWATIGLHPHDAVNGVLTLESILAAELPDPGGGSGTDKPSTIVVAIGECGLDYHYDHSPRDVQRAAFAAQIELAIGHRLALVVHTREAWDDTIDILTATGVPERTIIHCFTGGPEEARRCLDLGASLSFSGVVTFKSAVEVREAAQICPIERLLIETDSPFLTPVPHRGSPNEPARVPLVGATIATVKGVSRERVAEVTTANARAAFAL